MIRPAIPVLASLLLGAGVVSYAGAQDPPEPDFFWPYGTVQVDGANVEPAEQQVVAIVNGVACGESMTFVAAPGPGVPAGDVGKTVYVVDVHADGVGAGQRVGCGSAGDAVALYFPELRRLALQQPVFVVGGQRVDLALGAELGFRLQGPMVASDGVN